MTPSFSHKLLALLSSRYPLPQATSNNWAVIMQCGGGHYMFLLYEPVEAFGLKSIHYP